MKQIFILFCLVLSISPIHSQITSAVFPANGTEIEVIACDHIDPLVDEIGPNAVWDYSGLTGCMQEAWTYTFHDAEGSAEAENFPDANKYLEVDIQPSTKILIYSHVDESDWSIYGVKYNNAYIYCNGGESILQFPGALNDSWTFENKWSVADDTTSSMPVYTIEGEGTLILPNATYENVLRIRSMREDAVGLFTEEVYTYYSPEYQYHLFYMLVDDESQYQPNPIKVISSTADLADTKRMRISPNPTRASSNIKIELDISGNSDIEVLSNLGERLVTQKNAEFANGYYTLNIERSLAKGAYFVHILNDGLRYTSKLIIQ